MQCYYVEELEVEHVEAGGVELRDLNLFQQWFAQDTDRDSSESEEHGGKVLQH